MPLFPQPNTWWRTSPVRVSAALAVLFVYTLKAASPVPAEESAIWQLVPPQAHAGVVIEDMASFREAVGAHPYLRALTASLAEETPFTHETVSKFLSHLPVSENDAISFLWDRAVPKLAPPLFLMISSGTQGLNTTFGELYKAFDGAVAILGTEYEVVVRRGSMRGEWNTVLCASFTPEEREKVQEFLSSVLEVLPENTTWGRYMVGDVEVIQARYYLETRGVLPGARAQPGIQVLEESRQTLEYAFMDGHLVLGRGHSGGVRPILQWVAGSGDAAGPGGRRLAGVLANRDPEADATMFLHQGAIHRPRHAAGMRHFTDPWPLALGLEMAGPLLVSASIHPDQLSIRVYQGGLGEASGLLSLLTNAPDNTFTMASRLASSAPGFATITLNLLDLYEEYFETMRVVDRDQQRMAEVIRHVIRTALEVEIQTDFLPYYEGELVGYVSPPAEGEDRNRALFFIPAAEGTDRSPIFNRIVGGLSSDTVSFFDLQQGQHRDVTIWETPPPPLGTGRGDRLVMAAASPGILMSNSRGEAERVIDELFAEREDRGTEAWPDRLRELVEEHRRSGVKGFGYVSGELTASEFGPLMSGAGDGEPQGPAHIWWVAEASEDSILFRFSVESETPVTP